MIFLAVLALFSQLPAWAVQNVQISWNPSSATGVAGYKIYYGAASGDYTSVVDAGNTTNTTISGLADGSTNYFAATTYDASTNESAFSDEVVFSAPTNSSSTTNSVTVSTTPTNQPTGLNLVAGLTVTNNPSDPTSVIVTWTASTDAGVAGYQLFLGQASGNYSVAYNVYVPASSLVITGLVTGTTNYFAIHDFDTGWAHQSGVSPEVAFYLPVPQTTLQTAAPVLNVVGNLTLTTNAQNPQSVTLTWSPSSDSGVTGYLVSGGTASGNYTFSQSVGVGMTSLVVTGLVVNTTNYFTVQEHDGSGDMSAYAPEVSYLVPVPPPVLNAVGNLTLTTNAQNPQSVTLTWSASSDSGVVGYQVLGGVVPGNYTFSQSVAVGTTSLAITGLAVNTTNYFTVREFDANSDVSPLSKVVSYLVPVPPPVLNVVGNLTLATNAQNPQTVMLTWNPTSDSGVTGYQIFQGQSATKYTVTNTVNVASTSLVVTGLGLNTTNYFSIREYSTSPVVLGGLAPQVAYHVPLPKPVLHVVSNLTVSAGPTDYRSVKLVWTGSKDSGLGGYRLLSGLASGNYTRTVNIAKTATSVVVTGLVISATSYFALEEYDTNSNNGPLSQEVSWFVPVWTNHLPTLSPLTNMVLNINAGTQVIHLKGISTGSQYQTKTLWVASGSSNPSLIPTPSVSYSSPSSSGTISFTPKSGATGTAKIMVVVNNSYPSNNLFYQVFVVTVVNQALLNSLPKIAQQVQGSQTVVNKSATFSVGAAGQAPFKYQWKFNGNSIAGATNASLTILHANLANAGSYSVTVSNSVGFTNSAVAQLTVITNLAPTMTVPSMAASNGQFNFQVAGVAGENYVVQATSDFITWIPVATNTSPFTFTESNATQYGQRYYRSVYSP